MIRFGILGTYPPTRCGIATFSQSLATAIAADPGCEARVVRSLEQPAPPAGPALAPRVRVVADLVAGDAESLASAAAALEACDVALIQHEYGIYGGSDGDEVLELMASLRVPAVLVLHTVLPAPTERQRTVLERACALASAVVVMTRTALDTLERRYDVDPAAVRVIPHGIATWAGDAGPSTRGGHEILTWGLLGPGKGIERGIRALAALRATMPGARYRIVGQTHPKVLEREGDRYRDALRGLVAELGQDDAVTMDATYHDGPTLARIVASADVVLLPYDSREQVTSGVLVEAIAAGKPVVATAFPHAVELLADGAGAVVPHDDAEAMAAALGAALEGARSGGTADRAPLGATWAEVAARYRALAARLLAARAA